MVVESPTTPRESLAYPKKIPKIRSMGVYGIFVFLLIYRMIPPIRRPKITNSTTVGPVCSSCSVCVPSP